MRTLKATLLATLFVATAAPASAKSRAGVTLPDTQEVAGEKLVLNGLGIREATVFNVDVYVAGLYVEKKTASGDAVINDLDSPKRILMHFVRDVDRSDITGAYEEGFEKNAGKMHSKLKDRVKKLNSWMTAMKKGDRMSITYVPEKGVFTEVKGVEKGPIPGEDFAKVLFRIFFGPEPPNSDLKEGMLGKKD